MQPTLKTRKPVDALEDVDLESFPVWEYADDEEELEEQDETWVRPVDTAVILSGAYSLIVAASYVTASGRTFAGFTNVTTTDDVEIGGGALFHDNRCLYVAATDFWDAAADYKILASSLQLSETEVFPLRFTLAVPLEGESTLRSGEFKL